MKKVTALISIILIIAGSLCVSADAAPTTLDPIISTVHDDGNPSTLTSSSAQGIISRGSAGYTRQKIEVFDLEKLKTPEGYVLDQAVYSVYCITNYELVPSTVGIYELEADGFDFENTMLTMENMPERGKLIATFDMPGRVNGETYNKYMTFDLSGYFKSLIAEGKRYAAISAIQTARCTKGGMSVCTKYGDNPPMLTVTWREPSLVAENHGVFLGGAEMNELCDAEMTYSIDLYNETAADKTVRLILADICDNYCENIIVGEKITVGAGARETLSLNMTAASVSDTVRLFAVCDDEGVLRPVINEKYELTQNGWR